METTTASQPLSVKVLNEIDLDDAESAKKFKKFMNELFDKNGVLNNLRAHLRHHIVELLKNAQTGDTPIFQRHFTQRLELTFQALNILIAEYLLRLEFSYSLSVFVSELPLANMVFDFAKALLHKTDSDHSPLKFNDNDVCSILNYLGIKCDSETASLIMETYRGDEHTPLLLVILKCSALYRTDGALDYNQSLSSASSVSIDKENKPIEKCGHTAQCMPCQSRIARLRDKYRKGRLFKRKNKGSVESLNVEPLMRNIGSVERNLIDEMFEQLKSVYDAEMETLRAQDERKVKESLALQALQLLQKRKKMEESFREREKELELSVQQKKKFLWGLATALRDQHAIVARAMHAVHAEAAKLDAKESSLKTQITEAETLLRSRGEDMRRKISQELVVLEQHLECMQCERERISKERQELEQIKRDNESLVKKSDGSSKDLQAVEDDSNVRHHYELLKNELSILKKYLEMTKVEPRCVIERSTITDNLTPERDSSKMSIVLNNEQELERYVREEDILKPNQLVNELKMKKNVNFTQPKCSRNLSELYREQSSEQHSSESSIGDSGVLRQLRDENQLLKALAQQQREQISSLSAQQAHLQATLGEAMHQRHILQTPDRTPAANEAMSVGCRAGAGEELSSFGNAHPRILVPGDALPFIGVLKDRHNDNRRQAAVCQMSRARRSSPTAGPSRPHTRISPHKLTPDRTESGPLITAPRSPEGSGSTPTSDSPPARDSMSYQPISNQTPRPRPREAAKAGHNDREKSPKSVLKEAKEKLKSKPTEPPRSREKSPCSVLREAKLRLRKLEIEAEAVEQSYRDFRKRQAAFRQPFDEAIVTKDIPELGIRRSRSLQKLDYSKPELNNLYPMYNNTETYETLAQQTLKRDFDTYISQFQTKFKQETYFKNKNTVVQNVKQKPQGFSQNNFETHDEKLNTIENYLDKPVSEFRKLYNSHDSRYWIDRPSKPEDSMNPSRPSSPKRRTSPVKVINDFEAENVDVPTINSIEENQTLNAKKEAIKKAKDKKQAELEILKTNLTKIYNLKEIPETEHSGNTTVNKVTEESNNLNKTNTESEFQSNSNALRIEIENASGSNELKGQKPDDKSLLVVVESIVEAENIQSESECEIDRMHANMTILISPKRSAVNTKNTEETKSPERKRSTSPEQAAKFTRNDVLFHTENSGLETKGHSKDNFQDYLSEAGREVADDYADDFSDCTKSEEFNDSPISIAKSPLDDVFWDS